MLAAGNRGLMLALAGVALLLALTLAAYRLPSPLGPDATSSQDGDLTVVQRTVSLDPAADRGT